MSLTESEIKKSDTYIALKKSLGGTLSEDALLSVAKKALGLINGTSSVSGRKKSVLRIAEKKEAARQAAYEFRKVNERKEKLETTGEKITNYLLPELFKALANFVEDHGEFSGPKITLSLGKSDGQTSFSIQVVNYPTKPQIYTRGMIEETLGRLAEAEDSWLEPDDSNNDSDNDEPDDDSETDEVLDDDEDLTDLTQVVAPSTAE